ncbi:EcsC family protein [Panacibacter sp. DH6]|uniref:EcsC family protein n=1 Tax=Panacibacter microcysteis TaxID=2793269 RepID=A0A931E976_9BACT|nr:EcsC family protein [Panacibacter microcysteis]MBG9377630.1 EcsC family protein [Panacibacter microcysteis]
MNSYELNAVQEMKKWQRKMQRKPSVINNLSKKVQVKLNSYIPEKVHQAVTATIKQMVKAVLFGAEFTTGNRAVFETLEAREAVVNEKISFYKKTASAEGGITGAGGILLGLADFPILLGLKLKMLFEIASVYGYSVKDFRERLYILHIFQITFSSQQHRRDIFEQMKDWRFKYTQVPEDINQFDWRNFQQEYRDYIDIAKLAQLIPGIGAVVGIIVNYRLIDQLGETAKNAYRMRYADEQTL